jgi:glycosyltransferase involved in cell wall biosynthesis
LLLRPILAYSQPAKAGPSGLKVSDARLSVAPSGAESYGCRISDGFDDDVPNLRFDLPAQRDLLIQFLRSEQLEEIEVHHLLGHAPNIIAALSPLGLPYRVFIHDYVYWCPRITLCTIGPRYCGEPVDARICDACVADVGRRAGPDVPVDEMRVHSSRLLAAAREVVVSCEDVAIRMMRHFPDVATRIATWEDDTELAEAYRRASAGRVPQSHSAQVLVVGAIGADKGYDVLLGCVRDAGRRKLDLNFVLIGYSMDDERLIDAGSIFISGAFEEHEAVALVAAQQAHVGFIPSIWPETWCYSLSTMWRAGLRAAAFGLGAPAERIRRTGLGAVLPVGLTAERINDALLKLAAHKP